MNWIRARWRRISTGLLVVALAGIGGEQLYKTFFGADCCAPGSPCCHPGAACCHGKHAKL